MAFSVPTLKALVLGGGDMVLAAGEVAGEFDGEAPTRPWEREALDEGKKRLEELHLAAQAYVGPFKLPGPDKEEMEQVREVIRREGDAWR